MARVEWPGVAEELESGPVAGIIACAREEGGQGVACGRELRGIAAESVRTHQRGRRLTERAGADLLAERGDPPLPVHHDIDGNAAAADGRALLDSRLRPIKPDVVRDRRCEAQHVATIKGRGHGSDIEAACGERHRPGYVP